MALLVATNEDIQKVIAELAEIKQLIKRLFDEVEKPDYEWVTQKVALKMLGLTSKASLKTKIGIGLGLIRAAKDGQVYLYNLQDIKDRLNLLSDYRSRLKKY